MAIIIKKKVAPVIAAPLSPEAKTPVLSPAQALSAYPVRVGRTDRPNLDSSAYAVVSEHPNAKVGWYLMASYLYYHHHESLLSDGYYDQLACDILAQYDHLTHPHKHLLTRGDLEAGTLYALAADDYPLMTRAAAKAVVREAWGLIIQIGG